MENPQEIEARIATFKDLQSIVKTMKALSAVSIRQYETAVQSLADYYHTVELGLNVVLKDIRRTAPSPRRRGSGRLAAIVFGSDHGLCGRFNDDIASYAISRMNAATAPKEGRLILAVGARIAARLEQSGEAIAGDFMVPGSAARITSTVQQLLFKLDEWRTQEEVEYVYLYYNRHESGAGYRPTEVQLLPLDVNRFRRLEKESWPSRSLPYYSMDLQALFAHLLRQYFFVTLFRACAESQASEHASRLAAMQSAEKNLGDRLEEITAQYRRARQTAITSELLDVVGGFEALASDEEKV